MRKALMIIGAALLAVSVVATPVAASSAGAKPGSQTIADIVLANDGEFDVLQAAAAKAGLVGALDGRRQLTVFAPTDAAFVNTFEGLLSTTLTEQDVIDFIDAGGVDAAFGNGALADILLYHVTAGRRTSSSVLAAPGYRMLDGQTLTRGQLLASGVIQTDISASNGVIHVIGSVLLP
jgi:uncharacterized surface protein with fasciclin (FAS1) repeats